MPYCARSMVLSMSQPTADTIAHSSAVVLSVPACLSLSRIVFVAISRRSPLHPLLPALLLLLLPLLLHRRPNWTRP